MPAFGLSAGVIAQAKATYVKTLTETATITRSTNTADGYGGQTTATSTVATGVACRVAGGGAAAGGPDRVDGREGLRVWLNTTTEIKTGDTITVSGQSYTVLGKRFVTVSLVPCFDLSREA